MEMKALYHGFIEYIDEDGIYVRVINVLEDPATFDETVLVGDWPELQGQPEGTFVNFTVYENRVDIEVLQKPEITEQDIEWAKKEATRLLDLFES